MKHMGDYDASTVIYGKFTTFRPSTGAAYTLGGTPALSVYKDNSTTQSTTGVTLTADFDGVTGLNHFAIDTSADGTFYAAGSFFDIVVTTGTVDSVSVVGSVIASFTIRKDSSLKPTTAGRTLDVSAGGEAGLDWANVGSPTTVVGLSGTTIKTATDVETDTADIQSRLPAALVSGRMDSYVGAMGADTITNSAVAASAVTEIQAGLSTLAAADIRTAVGLASANLDTQLSTITGYVDTETSAASIATAVWNAATASYGTAGSYGELLETNIDAAISSRLSSASISLSGGAVTVGTNNDKTGYRLSSTGVDDVWDEVVDGSLTGRQSVRLINSSAFSKLSGAATTSIVIRDAGDTKDRITATVDADGNRTAVTLDAT